MEFLTSTADPTIVLDTVCALFPIPGIIETALNKTDILRESLSGSIRLFIPLSPRKNISIDEVVAIIAGLAATEVEGVDSLGGNITNEIVSKLGMKNLSKGVKVTVEESSVLVDITLNLKYGTQIPAVSAKVQDKVKSAIETMTGLSVTEVNIKVASVNVEN